MNCSGRELHVGKGAGKDAELGLAKRSLACFYTTIL